MKRHPAVVAREQRAMRQARTVAGRRTRAGDDVDGRNAPPPREDNDTAPCRVVRWCRDGTTVVLARTTITAGVRFAARLSHRTVVHAANGRIVFDNHAAYWPT